MDLSPADDLLPGEELVVGEHAGVAGVGRHRQVARVGERHCAGGDDAESLGPGGRDEPAAQRTDALPQVGKAGDDGGVGLDDGALQLGSKALTREGIEQDRGAWNHLPRVDVDDVELLLDTQRQRCGADAGGHGLTVGGRYVVHVAPCYIRASAPVSFGAQAPSSSRVKASSFTVAMGHQSRSGDRR